jgi:succinate dehydrogenase/fumarate reductase flavoprotein subunit
MLDYLRAGNALEVTGDAAHYATGGIRIDENCASTLPGLFAAGECTAGCFGAQRICSAVSEMVVEGHVAGVQAAAFARAHGRAPVPGRTVSRALEAIYAPLERADGARPVPLRVAFQKIVGDKVGVIRSEEGLRPALAELAAFSAEAERLATVSKALSGNREWWEALSLRNMLVVMEVSARSALLRRESRGGHYRSDYPMIDNDAWLVNIVARRAGDAPALRTEPVVVTKVPLPTGMMRYEDACRVSS